MKITRSPEPNPVPVYVTLNLLNIAPAGLYETEGGTHIAIVGGSAGTGDRTSIVFNLNSPNPTGYSLASASHALVWRAFTGSITLSNPK